MHLHNLYPNSLAVIDSATASSISALIIFLSISSLLAPSGINSLNSFSRLIIVFAVVARAVISAIIFKFIRE